LLTGERDFTPVRALRWLTWAKVATAALVLRASCRTNAVSKHTSIRGRLMAATKRKSSAKKSSGRKYGKAASKRVESAMRRRKKGTLKSGRGGKGGRVKSRKQAIAIGLSEARKKGAKVPRKRTTKRATKRTARKK
jgi:hypothetical protein